MAEQLHKLKRRMKSVSSTQKITNAMKFVSAARLNQATVRYNFVREQLSEVRYLFGATLSGLDEHLPKRLFGTQEGPTLYLVYTATKGFCGSFNTMMDREIEKAAEDPNGALFITVGEKGRDHCDYLKYHRIKDAGVATMEALIYKEAFKLAELIVDMYRDRGIGRAILVYPKYINSLYCEPGRIQLIPLEKDKLLREGGGRFPEPEVETLDMYSFTRDLLLQYESLIITEKQAEALVCEHSARRTAMNNATDNAEEVMGKLSQRYNRARQTEITNEIIEIIAGADAQRKTRPGESAF